MLSVQSSDNRLTIWDLAAENDDQAIQEEDEIDVPD